MNYTREHPVSILSQDDNEMGSYDDVLSLINEAKAVSDSIEDSLKDMKQHFDLNWKEPQMLVEEEESEEEEEDAMPAWMRPVTKKLPETEQPLKKEKKKSGGAKKQVTFGDSHTYDIPKASARQCQRLYYSEQEQEEMVVQMQCDVMDLEEGRPDSDDFTGRGLERRTLEGIEQRTNLRLETRNRVLDEQDRQWDILPLSEPVDEFMVAQVSLQSSRQAREEARQWALQDEREVLYGDESSKDDEVTVTEEASIISGRTAVTRSTTSTRLSSSTTWQEDDEEEEESQYGVRFPEDEVDVVYLYDQEVDVEDLWYPNTSLEEIKQELEPEIAYLTLQQQEEHDATALAKDIIDTESLRGLESYTPQSQQRLEKLRAALFQVVYSPRFGSGKDAPALARACLKISSKSRREARERGLYDQRAFKDNHYQHMTSSASSQPKKTTPSARPPLLRKRSSRRCILERQDEPCALTSLALRLSEHDTTSDETKKRSSIHSTATASTVASELSYTSSFDDIMAPWREKLAARRASLPATSANDDDKDNDATAELRRFSLADVNEPSLRALYMERVVEEESEQLPSSILLQADDCSVES